MKLLSGVLFLKSLCAPLCTALIPRQAPTCDLGPGWTFLRRSLALVQISNCIGFEISRKQEPSDLQDFEASELCFYSGPSNFVLGGGLASPKPEVIWRKLNIHSQLIGISSVTVFWLVL